MTPGLRRVGRCAHAQATKGLDRAAVVDLGPRLAGAFGTPIIAGLLIGAAIPP
jgi:hypothetical protein